MVIKTGHKMSNLTKFPLSSLSPIDAVVIDAVVIDAVVIDAVVVYADVIDARSTTNDVVQINNK